MSHSFLSVACAGLLLAAGAYAASESASGPDMPVAAPAAAKAKPALRPVHVFVTLRDAAGKALARSGVRIEGDGDDDIGVGVDGAKLSLPVNGSEPVRVLFPGGNCSVTPGPKAIASGRVSIVVERTEAGPRCAIVEAAGVDTAASAASAASVSGAGAARERSRGRAVDGPRQP